VRILPFKVIHKASIRGADPWHTLCRETVTKVEAKQGSEAEDGKKQRFN
jgi:hypothetical protein